MSTQKSQIYKSTLCMDDFFPIPYVEIDYREERSGVHKQLEALGIPCYLKNLAIFDYKIGEYGIERKAIGDYITSQQRGHAQNQLYNASVNKPISFLIIEGELRTWE